MLKEYKSYTKFKNNTSTKVYIRTFGCQMNVYDSSKITCLLETMGYETTDNLYKANLALVNTCSIREKAEQKCFSLIGRLQKIKKKNPSLRIIVCGCIAQREKTRLFSQFPGIDLIFGTLNIEQFPLLLQYLFKNQKRICKVLDEPLAYDNSREWHCGFVFGDRISAWVTIMEGCNNFCAYCVVPYVRGRERSRHPDTIVNQIKSLVNQGCREVTLLGQNVNSYGVGLNIPCNFSDLLNRINEIEGLSRIRFTTSHSKDFSSELIEIIRDCDKVCEHVHLPLQSGSNKILARMNRGYTLEEYLDKVDKLKSAIPDVSLTGDMIVGFPGESDADFQETIDAMKKIRFDGLFSFKYSKRPQTKALEFNDHVREDVKLARLKNLQQIETQIGLEKNMNLVGKTVKILIEGKSKKDKTMIFGRTRGNKIVNCMGDSTNIGKIIPVKITKAKPFDLMGEILTGEVLTP